MGRPIIEGDLVFTEEALWEHEKVALVTQVDDSLNPARLHILCEGQEWSTWEDEVELVNATPRSL